VETTQRQAQKQAKKLGRQTREILDDYWALYAGFINNTISDKEANRQRRALDARSKRQRQLVAELLRSPTKNPSEKTAAALGAARNNGGRP